MKGVVANEMRELYAALRTGDRVALGRAITMVESTLPKHRASANLLLDLCMQDRHDTFRFAVSGAPGVGKSTFIEVLGKHITAHGTKLAVLTIDPSSRISGGSILGDKTRMAELVQNPNVYIRPSAAGDALGGVTSATREAIALCEAAGYENICIETVGVGQSEVTVRDMCDLMLLLVSPGGGDDLQGIKRGIVELADMIAVNKSDGSQEQLATTTRQHYIQASHLFPPKPHGEPVKVVNCSALNDRGIDTIWRLTQDFYKALGDSGYLARLRAEQDLAWLHARVAKSLERLVMDQPQIRAVYDEQLKMVRDGSVSVGSAVSRIEMEFRKTLLS